MEGKARTRDEAPNEFLEFNGEQLRRRARSKRPEERKAARAELRRRRGNLRGAVVGEWECDIGQDINDA